MATNSGHRVLLYTILCAFILNVNSIQVHETTFASKANASQLSSVPSANMSQLDLFITQFLQFSSMPPSSQLNLSTTPQLGGEPDGLISSTPDGAPSTTPIGRMLSLGNNTYTYKQSVNSTWPINSTLETTELGVQGFFDRPLRLILSYLLLHLRDDVPQTVINVIEKLFSIHESIIECLVLKGRRTRMRCLGPINDKMTGGPQNEVSQLLGFLEVFFEKVMKLELRVDAQPCFKALDVIRSNYECVSRGLLGCLVSFDGF